MSLQEGKYHFPPQHPKKVESPPKTTASIERNARGNTEVKQSDIIRSTNSTPKTRKYTYSFDGNINQYRASNVTLTPPVPQCTAGSASIVENVTKSDIDLNKPSNFKKLKKDGTTASSSSLSKESIKSKTNSNVILILIYATINSIMCVPCLYGYASVIFNNPIYQPHINALSKLMISSSVVHQLCFSYFSSLDFSVDQV